MGDLNAPRRNTVGKGQASLSSGRASIHQPESLCPNLGLDYDLGLTHECAKLKANDEADKVTCRKF